MTEELQKIAEKYLKEDEESEVLPDIYSDEDVSKYNL